MKINVGSRNPTKLAAAKNMLENHDLFIGSEVIGVDIEIEEFDHPKSINETISGAKKRAAAAFSDCILSVGIEGGLMEAPGTKSGYFEITVCALYDGKDHHLGMSPGFEWPKEVTKKILNGLDGSQAFKEAGLTSHEKIGTGKGATDVLTKGKANRTGFNELAIMTALIHLENPQHY